MKKRILSLLLALVMCLSLLPTAAFAEGGIDTIGGTDGDTTLTGSTGDTGDGTAPTPVVQSVGTPMVTAAGLEHTAHCTCATEHEGEENGCSGTDLTGWASCYNFVTQKTELPSSAGCYYLTDDVVLDKTWELKSEGSMILVLCLNGHTITRNGEGPVITVSGGATLFLTDCGGGEVTYNDRTTEGCTVKVAGGTFKLYNGTITHAAGTSGSGVRVESGGKFEMYGGKITGNSGTTRTNPDNSTGICGGGVYIAPGGTFDMSGGSITGNTALSDGFACGGGGVYIEPVEKDVTGGTFNMSGGTISGNEASGGAYSTGGGGGVFIGDRGTFNMSGGEISGNTAAVGGGIFARGMFLDNTYNNLKFTMSGGTITGNNATVNGGGVYGAGAYHDFSGSSATIPSRDKQEGSVFLISGTANVTGNTVGGTKGSDGKYTGGTKNNMYVTSWIYSIYVADDFSGSFGVTVDEGDWSGEIEKSTYRHGTYWQVVKYKLGVSETYSRLPSSITYDNERFSFELSGPNKGRLNCNHFGAANSNNTTGYECSICGSTSVEAEVTFADKTKRCYELLQNAISEAGDDGTVKMLDDLDVTVEYDTKYPLDMNGKSVTLDMNGKTIKVNLVPITIKNGTLDITGNAGKIDCSGGLQVANGAKLIVSGTSPEINSLTVQSGGAAELKGGTYGSITAPTGKACNDLLADGYAFFRSSSPLDGSANNFPAVEGALITIVSHTCDGFNDGKCNACGRTCPHSSIGTDGQCTGCQKQMVAQVTKTTGGIAGETAYFTGFKDAVDSIKFGDTNVTIKLLANHTVSTDLTIDKACTLDLNRQTLTVDTGKTLTVNSTVTIKGAESTVAGEGGQIAGTVVAGASADLTIEGDLTIGELTADVSATVKLKGGTYKYISIEEKGTDESSKTIASLLAPGYAFASTATENNETRNLYGSLGTDDQDLTVVQCAPHGMYDNETNCMFCNTEFAVSVNVGNVSGAQPYYCQTLSEAMAYINGKTNNVDNVPNDTTTINITLLGNVTEKNGSNNKTITLNRRNPLELNLTGKTLTANITVASNTTLTMRGSGTLAGTLDVLSGGNAKLFNGTFNKITVAGGSVKDLLGENCGYYSKEADDSKTWLMSDDASLNGTSLTNISVQLIPIKSVSISSYMSTYGYGNFTSLTAKDVTGFDNKEITNGVTYQWYKVEGETKSKLSGATAASYQTSNDLAVGEHTFRCEVTVDGYTVGKAVKVTVNKITLNSDTYYPTANTLTFTTQNIGGHSPEAVAQQLVTAPTATLPDGCKVYYRLGENDTFAEAIPTATNAGTYTVQWYIDASGNGNYSGVGSKDDPRELTVKIEPMKVAKAVPTENPEKIQQLDLYHKVGDTYSSVSVTYTYTGSEIRPEFQLQNADGYVIASGYSVTYGNNIKASSFGNSATITIKDTNPNDNFEIQDSTFLFDIALKSVTLTPDSYTYYAKKPENGSISFDLTDIAKALGMPEDDGELVFKLSTAEPGDNGPTGPVEDESIDMEIVNGVLTLSGAYVTGDTPYTGKVLVSSDNHKGNFTLNVEVSEKTVPTINVNAFTKTYDGAAVTLDDVTKNATVTATGVTSNIEGAWSWNAPEGKPKDVADSNNYLLTFTPTDTTNYTSATATVQVTIAPLKILIAGADLKPKTYDGKTDVEFGTGGVTFKKEDAPNTPVTLTMGTDYTATATLSNPYANETRAQVSVKLLTGNYRFGNYDEATKNITCQVSPAPLKVTAQAAPKTYDGDTSVDSYNVSFKGIVTGDSLDPTKDYTVTAAFADADAGTGKKVIVTVTLSETVFGQRYCFMVDDKASRTISVETTADIDPLPLTTPPTAKESIVRIRQDVSVPDGSYLLSENVSGVLPDGFELSGELRFALGALPAKLEAQIDENTGMLTYSISGGRSGEKFAIPVTLTMPNFVKHSGAAAVALYALNDDQAQEIDPNAGTITIGFTVEIELTGGSHHHIRRQPTGTGTTSGGANNGSTGGNGSGVASPATGDAGIALYGVLAVLSMTGGAWIGRKKR